ncbi:hypothetical protein P167DRAFT_580675 [Morchella conica CCBAS932]|uniref:Uncharacterized protein n=1 Tax=Morchella conica CCBAS932 TaxID=1392247 RepID=A0A3N4K714_9PEZI|nr:hypothetical protein P167DRAFT_580675 [Morchella conica CCBAS932]
MAQRSSVDGVSVSRYLLVVFTMVTFELDFRSISGGRNRFGNGSALSSRLLTEGQYDVERGSLEGLVVWVSRSGAPTGLRRGEKKDASS